MSEILVILSKSLMFMKTASLSELKKELKVLPPEDVIEHCIRLAKYKKENKELLDYLLFNCFDEDVFIQDVKTEINVQFVDLNESSLYLAKKTLRKVLRTVNKFIKFSGSKKVELELCIYYLQKINETNLAIENSKVLSNLYHRQLDKIEKALSKIHEDFHLDYSDDIEELKKVFC